MEALKNQLTTGEQSGGQEHHQPESPQRAPQCKSPSLPCQEQQTSSSKLHSTPQQTKQYRRQNPERKRLRHQRQSIDSDTVLKNKHETATEPPTISGLSTEVLPSSADAQTESISQEDNPKQKRERKPQRPGKYVCTYCGRACAKPSVLQKHIRSHTGERPYPCAPCGFSFKTKSNLYKHRKSHTHRVKAGLALGEPKSIEDQVTESEDETRKLSSVPSLTDRQRSVVSAKGYEMGIAKECTAGPNDSYAVKKRLALRLSKGKQVPQDSSEEKTSSQTLGSKGSTESGYFSHSESTERSQDSPPNTSAKSYAEIILGKYGRLGQLQRMSRHHNKQLSGQEEKNISFTVPKKQVIDHITKLITINEAVVDTSKIDSVKPRRFSLSRKNSSEAQRTSGLKESLIHSPKAGDLGYKSTGSISMGVPCEKFHNLSLKVEQAAGQISTSPLFRSHSMPSACTSFDASSSDPRKFHLSQSFDEQQLSETQMSRRYGTLRRQPAIEIPPATELGTEEHEASHSFYPQSKTTVADHKQNLPQPYECEVCGTGCKDWEGYKKHKQNLCFARCSQNEVKINQIESPHLGGHAVRPGTSTVRKRRKEESFEFDDPSSSLLSSSTLPSGQCKSQSSIAHEDPRKSALQTCSVIQHTSLFEKQESLCNENQLSEKTNKSPPHEEHLLVPKKEPQCQSTKHTCRKLVRQNNVQVPEILVTEEMNIIPETSIEPASTAKPLEKLDEFQWPQRGLSLAQLPIEKLPPKKKRLRLAEVAQSSGESSFDSASLPRSPSQDSSASYASSRSTSYEEPTRGDMEITSAPLRKSRAPHMLMVPGVHQHREMRRSASEQAPHDAQLSVLTAETRSKSFDYSCLSPDRTAAGWKERRKCLLIRHAAIRDREEEEDQGAILNRSPEHVSRSKSCQASLSNVYCNHSSSPLSSGRDLIIPEGSRCRESLSKWKLNQNIPLKESPDLSKPFDPSVSLINETSYIHPEQLPPQAPQHNPTYGASGAARAHYLPMPTGLKLEIPTQPDHFSEVRMSNVHQSVPHITSSLEVLRPLTSPTIAVRLQADTLTPACAIYTTLSQSNSPRPQEAVDAVSPNISISATEYRNHQDWNLDLHLSSDNGQRLSGSGGNKRMLSPSNSIEFNPESQQQQKRVKEEKNNEVECTNTAAIETFNQELKQEKQSCSPGICSAVSSIEPSFPSLLSSTSNSWCYLNYIKPNHSTLDEQKPSVYSSWSTSSYDPNPPGLSSKAALSLLHCKQRLSPSIYTTSSMSVKRAESREHEDNKTPYSSQVYNSPVSSRDYKGTGNDQLSTEDDRSGKYEEKKDKTRQKEQIQSHPTNKHCSEALFSMRRSDTQHSKVCDRGGEKNATVLHTESPLCNCSQCSSALKAPEIRVEHRTSTKCEEETSSHPQDTHEDQSVHPDQQKDVQEVTEKVGHDATNCDDNEMSKHGGGEEGSRSTEAESSHTDREKSPTGGQGMEYTCCSSTPLSPKDVTKKSSASVRRALFARRRLNTPASTSPGISQFPSTPSPDRQKEPCHNPSPPSCQCPAPPSSISSSAFPTSAPQSLMSALRGLPLDQSQGSDCLVPPGSPKDCSDPSHACPLSKDLLSTERLSVNEANLNHVSPHSTRPRGSDNVLSHLPLHSQQPGRTLNLLIPIGGIHMIQPRSILPLYSLVGNQTATTSNMTASSGQSNSPKVRLALQHQQNTLKEMLPSSQTASQSIAASGQMSAGEEGLTVEQPSSLRTVTRHPDSLDSDRLVYIETTQGQKTSPSRQTCL